MIFRYKPVLVACALCVFSLVSCRDFYTTSLAKDLKRSDYSISSSTPVDDLVKLAEGSWGDSKDGATAVLEALAQKPASEVGQLSTEEKTLILGLAGTATVDMSKVTETVEREDLSSSEIAEELLASFDSSVNLSSVETILSDTDYVNEGQVDVIIMAAAVVAAQVVASSNAELVMDVLAGNVPVAVSGLTEAQQTQLELVIQVADTLEARNETTEFFGYDLLELLKGNQ